MIGLKAMEEWKQSLFDKTMEEYSRARRGEAAMTHKELHEKHGLKEYDVTLKFRLDEPWHERNEAGMIFPAAVGFNTFQVNKAAAVAAGLNQIGSQGFQLKDIASIEVEEKTG